MTLRIAYCSDIHWEFGPIELKGNADVLILAGDIYFEKNIITDVTFQTFLKNLIRSFKNIIIIPGNHEFYHGYWQKSLDRLRVFYKNFHEDIHFLENNYIDIHGIRFIGSTLWTDMDNKNPFLLGCIQYIMNDYKLCRNDLRDYKPLSVYDTIRRNMNSCDFLKDCIQDKSMKHIIITHHAPSIQSAMRKPNYDPVIDYAYVNNLENFIEQNQQITHWIHGHTHHKLDYMVGSTRVLCNPRGYIGYESIADSFQLEYFDIDNS